MNNPLPILYSFRRCPYAIRARMALFYSGIQIEHREILLRDKPRSLLKASPKGTVPVLITSENKVIDESWDIMIWALNQHDPDQLLPTDPQEIATLSQLLEQNDFEFKPVLDQYKYASKCPEQAMEAYRKQGEQTLVHLNLRLSQHSYLISNKISIIDLAIMPFIRQFAHVDNDWFQQLPYSHLQKWLSELLNSKLFEQAMEKHPLYDEGLDLKSGCHCER